MESTPDYMEMYINVTLESEKPFYGTQTKISHTILQFQKMEETKDEKLIKSVRLLVLHDEQTTDGMREIVRKHKLVFVFSLTSQNTIHRLTELAEKTLYFKVQYFLPEDLPGAGARFFTFQLFDNEAERLEEMVGILSNGGYMKTMGNMHKETPRKKKPQGVAAPGTSSSAARDY